MILTGMLLLAASAAAGASPTVTAKWSCADRGEGFAYYSGDVRVVDDSCEIRASRAYVYMDGTNKLHRGVAFGGVVVTNGVRRAYGDRLSYYHDTGIVVVASGSGRVAEAFGGLNDPQAPVRGRKVRLWTQSGQVEVLESEIAVAGQNESRRVFNGTFGK